MRTLPALILSAWLLTTVSASVGGLDDVFDKHVVKDGPGLAVLVLRDRKVVFKRTAGKADLETGVSLRSDTPIYIASIAKEFTAVAIMMLAERGKLRYDDKLPKYFPEFAAFGPEITLHHMLTHTSGLPDHLDIMKDNVSGWTNDDVVQLLKRENRVLFKPGEKASYSNSAYVLLSMIVERVSGQSFTSFLRKNIFDPVGMKNTYVAVKGAAIPGRARGYMQNDGGKWSLDDYDAFTTGAGGVYSTLDDLQRWDEGLSSGRLVNPDTMKLASIANKLNSGKPTAYGYGWLAEFAAKGDLANVWYVAGYGDFKGFKGMHKWIPDRHFSVIVLTNQGDFPWDILEKAQAIYATKTL
jgi:CubicO group peptidase (beta-lactamase class C family)